jgi:hypothetical protein
MTERTDVEAMDQRCAICPFCQEHGLDAIGLKKHLVMWCATFKRLPPLQTPFYGW